jgi:hypothetical protein
MTEQVPDSAAAEAAADPGWYTLDNAGKVFPAIVSERQSTVFRVAATLTEEVHTDALAAALSVVITRFPYFQVYLRRGFFWYYLERTNASPAVLPDSRYPCEKILMKRKGVFLIRVRVFGKRIAVECSHTLTDGFGALTFLRSLLAEYLDLLHGPFADRCGLPRPGEAPDPAESEDSFVRFYNKLAPPPKTPSRAYHLTGRLLPAGEYIVVTGAMSVAKLKEAARARGASINDLLVAALFHAIQEQALSGPRRRVRPIRLIVPLDLRKIFGSRTLRNFSLFAMPEVDPRLGRYGFDEILARVHHFMRMETNEKSVHSDMSRNVRAEKSMLVRLLPLVLKDLVFAAFFFASGERAATSSISNLGPVTLPSEMAGYVRAFDFIPATGRQTRTSCGIISYGDELRVSFGRNIRSAGTERLFFAKLMELGVSVKMVS